MIAIFNSATGAVLEHVVATSGIDMTGKGQKTIPVGYDASTYSWSVAARQYVEDPAKIEAVLVGQVKAEGERRSMLVMSTGGAKKTKYAAKAVEVENWYGLGGVGAATSALLAAFNLLNTTVRARKFRYAIADAKAHGDSVDKAIARFVAGADASQNEAARLEGIEQAGVDAIKAATTVAAKRAAHAAINWAAA
ncbi:hypothetical protein [Sphingomonas profundi]|uniref:hypothetical protein n=1 Tax=Alterirhizorhabdus profundi TaxID=2681549 RepID=UPI0012E8BC47|nr:hypothetical protein [Sphingomonas profundi]